MANDFVIPDRRGLVAEHLLNGNANDTSGNGYDGTPLNVTYSITDRGYQKYAGNFNGSNSQVERTGFTSMDSLNVGTYQMVIRIAGVGQGAGFALQGLDNNTEKTGFMGWDSSGQCSIGFFFGGADLGTFATVPYNTTVHVVGVKTATTASIYVNGVLASSVANSRTTTNTTTFRRFNIGKHYWASGNANRFNGSIQSVRIFNRALSETEIRNWYLESLRSLGGSTLAGLMSRVIAYYDFRGDANDIVGGYDGTVNGATLTTDRFGNTNSAYSFSGTSQYIALADNDIVPSSYTIIAGCKFSAFNTGTTQSVYRVNDTVNYTSADISVGATGIFGATQLTAGVNYILARTYSGTTLKSYVDGTLSQTATVNWYPQYQWEQVIGAWKNWNNSLYQQLMKGNIDFVMLISGALDDTAIKTISALAAKSKLLPFV